MKVAGVEMPPAPVLRMTKMATFLNRHFYGIFNPPLTYDDRLGISSLEGGIFIVVFESANIVNSIELFFNLMWKQGRKVF